MASQDRTTLSLSERVYAVLLVAYPKEFRRAFGPLMVQMFGDLCRDERGRGGVIGLMGLWLTTLPDLLSSATSERSRAVGNALARVGGLARLRNLMILNGVLLLAFGIVFANAAPVQLFGIGTSVDWRDPNEYAVVAMGRLVGVVCVGFGALLLATGRVAERFARQAVSGTLFLTYLLGSLSLLGVQLAMWESPAGWITVALHLFFAAGYGLFWFKDSLVGTLAHERTPTSGTESYWHRKLLDRETCSPSGEPRARSPSMKSSRPGSQRTPYREIAQAPDDILFSRLRLHKRGALA